VNVSPKVPNILAIDPGSASTKIALFCDEDQLLACTLRHDRQELAACGAGMLSQLGLRLGAVDDALEASGLPLNGLRVIVGRGGLLHPLTGGVYQVSDVMLEELRRAGRGDHASNLGAFLAHAIATRIGVPAYIVDPVSVDEWVAIARLSGCAQLERPCLSHALNSKATARRYAMEAGSHYEDMLLVVAHLGSGHTISAHAGGRMIDATNSREEGAFSSERAGSVPAMELVRLCFSGRYTQQEVEKMLIREGGLQSYLGTGELAEVERRMDEGDERAGLVFRAMAYQIAKEIGAMATVLNGRVDAILLTGGMAHSRRLCSAIIERVAWIAPVKIYPGEEDLRALAAGALRVLRGEEQPKEFLVLQNV